MTNRNSSNINIPEAHEAMHKFKMEAASDDWNAGHSSRIHRAARGWEQPSDHAPVFASFDL